MDNHTEALAFAMSIISSAKAKKNPEELGVPANILALAHLYAGEALIYLDRISEATTYLDPKLVPNDVSFLDPR